MSRSRLIWSGSRFITTFLRKHRIAFHRDYVSLYFSQHGGVFSCSKCSFSQHPQQQELQIVLLIIPILKVLRWNLNMALICISLMDKGVEHLFFFVLLLCFVRFVAVVVVLVYLFLKDRAFLCNIPDYPGTRFVGQAGLKLIKVCLQLPPEYWD